MWYQRARVRRARSSRDVHARLGRTGCSRPRRRRQSRAGWEPAGRGPLGERPGARSGQRPSVPGRQTCFRASELRIGATRGPRQIRGSRQRRRDLGGSLGRRGKRCAVYGGGLLDRCELSKRLRGEAGHGRAGARRGLTGWTGRARERRGALGRRTMRTPMPRRGEPRPAVRLTRRAAVLRLRGARTTRSHGALVHGHARPVGRRRAVPCTVSADVRAAAQHASGGQDQHQSAEQEPQARHRPQEQPFPHRAQDNPGHVPRPGRQRGPVDAAFLPISSIRTWSAPGLPRFLLAQ